MSIVVERLGRLQSENCKIVVCSTILHAAIVFAEKWQNLRYENISVWYFWPSVNLLHKNHLDVDCWGKVRGVAVRKLQNRGSTILHVAIVFAGQKWLVRHSSCECAIFDRTKPLSSQAKHYIPRRGGGRLRLLRRRPRRAAAASRPAGCT